jgi:altronate dehydratase large subunit
MEFLGYRRKKGPAGIRNHLLILPSVACANGVARAIGQAIPEAEVFEHGHGCGRRGGDIEIVFRSLTGLGKNPNVGAVLIIGLGCEGLNAASLAEEIAHADKPVETIAIQDLGGSVKTTEKGISLAQKMSEDINSQRREAISLADITMGVECGGSDSMSGVTANPAVGAVADWLVEQGGTVILAESTEMIGTNSILKKRAINEQVAGKIDEIIGRAENMAKEILGPKAHLVIAPGNMDGGLSSIVEKSLGCIQKGGQSTINEVVEYSQRPSSKGLVLMDTPGYDVESIGGLVAGGSQIVFFTTGRGTPLGAPIAPVVKVSSNSELYRRMEDDIDIDAGSITTEEKTLFELRDDMIQYMKMVLEGERTKAELHSQGFMTISTRHAAF